MRWRTWKRSPPEAGGPSKWSLADRWIISRFARTLEAANTAIATYRFDQYAKACYDFFWGDFCDWYVEAIKPALRDPARAGQTANVLAAMIDGALRLMHPMIPFITEVLFWKLNELRPDRTLGNAIKLPPGQRLIKAAWPISEAVSEDAESQFSHLQEIIVAIRNLRTQYNVKPSQSVTVSIGAAGAAAANDHRPVANRSSCWPPARSKTCANRWVPSPTPRTSLPRDATCIWKD